MVTSSPSFGADTCVPAVRLKVGDKVTDCDRIGLSEQADLETRKQLVEGDYNKKILDEQQKIIDLKDLQIKYTTEQKDLWQSDAMRERAAYDAERSRTNMNFWIGLGAGILLTVAAGWAVGQAAGGR